MPSPYRLLNPAINGLLRSPLHRILSGRVMTVHYRGRRTGRSYAVPVSYLREGGLVYCFTNGRWRHNFAEPQPVELRVRGTLLRGVAQAGPAHTEEGIATMGRYFAGVPADAKFYGVSFAADGRPDAASVRRAAGGMTLITTRLEGG